jgi:hypothetical protein
MGGTVISTMQRLHRLRSLALFLSLSLTLKRLCSYGTPKMGHVLLKPANHSLRSPGVHVTSSQTLSFSQTLSHSLLLLSSSQTLKQTPLKSSLKGLIATISVPLRLHVISGSRFKQLSFSAYLTQRLSKYLTLQITRSSTLETTALYHKKGVKLNTSRFILLKKKSLRNSYLPRLLTGIYLIIRCLTICHSFILRRQPSVQLSAILATADEFYERRGFQIILLYTRRD